jgi:hypothetical protein
MRIMRQLGTVSDESAVRFGRPEVRPALTGSRDME